MKLSKLKTNPDNPRFIRNDSFEKLKKSITEFPKMMELRPIIVDENYMILGGNMRFKALKELNYKDIPDNWVKRADELTEDEKREFIIKDNNNFGDWDFEILEKWDKAELSDWGVDIPDVYSEYNKLEINEEELLKEFDPIGDTSDLTRIVILLDTEEEAKAYLKKNNLQYKKTSGSQGRIYQVNLSKCYGK